MTAFSIQPWQTKSPLKAVVVAVGAGMVAFAGQAVVLDKLFAQPLTTLSQPAHQQQRHGYTESILVKAPIKAQAS